MTCQKIIPQQINNIKNEKSDISRDFTGIKMIWQHYKQTHANKFNNIGKMNKFYDTLKLPKLTQEKNDNLNSLISVSNVEFIV